MDPSLLDPLVRAPERAGVFLDFDGTLSEIVAVPSAARPARGAREALAALAAAFRVVALVSGRGAGELAAWLGDEVEIWGTHGAERARGGRVELAARAAPWQRAAATARDEAAARIHDLGLEGAVVEDKTVVVGLHWRNAADRRRSEAALRKVAAELADVHGLVVAESKMALELRPPVEFSKADVVLRRAREEDLAAVMFAGDDVVDLPAFDALDSLAGDGVATLRVAVDSDETPPEVVRRADVAVAGPAGAIALLEELATRAARPS